MSRRRRGDRTAEARIGATVSEPQEQTDKATEGAETRRNPLTSRRVLWAFVGLTAIGILAVVLTGSWKETRLHEATLPQIEAQSQQDPFDGRLLALMGARRAEAEEYPGAIDALTRALGAREDQEAVWLTLAACYAAEGNASQANAALRLGMQRPALSASLQEALQHGEQAGGSPSAIAAAICPRGTKWLATLEAPGSFLNGFSEWYGRHNPDRSGFATRAKWAMEAPDDPTAQRVWGETLVANRRYTEAESVLRHGLALAPNSAGMHLDLAKALDVQGAKGKAGVEYVACIKRDPNNLAALRGLGRIALDKKLLQISVEVYERASKLDPNNPDVWVGLGQAYYNQKLNLAPAQAAFAKASVIAPGRTDFFLVYANTMRAMSHYDEAESLMRRRIADDPSDAQTRYVLGLLLLEHNVSLEREVEAENQLRESLRLQPDVAAVEARLGRLQLDRDKTQDAIQLLEAAVHHDKYNLEATLSLVRAYRQAGRKQDAQLAQESATELSGYVQHVAFLEDQANRQPDGIKTITALAALYEQGGEAEKAAREREILQVLKASPVAARRGLRAVKNATSLSTPTSDSGVGH